MDLPWYQLEYAFVNGTVRLTVETTWRSYRDKKWAIWYPSLCWHIFIAFVKITCFWCCIIQKVPYSSSPNLSHDFWIFTFTIPKCLEQNASILRYWGRLLGLGRPHQFIQVIVSFWRHFGLRCDTHFLIVGHLKYIDTVFFTSKCCFDRLFERVGLCCTAMTSVCSTGISKWIGKGLHLWLAILFCFFKRRPLLLLDLAKVSLPSVKVSFRDPYVTNCSCANSPRSTCT